jgi:hypothetical protein
MSQSCVVRVLCAGCLAVASVGCAAVQKDTPPSPGGPSWAHGVGVTGGAGVATTDFGKQALDTFKSDFPTFNPVGEVDDSAPTVEVGGYYTYGARKGAKFKAATTYFLTDSFKYENAATATGPGGQTQIVFNRGTLEANGVRFTAGPALTLGRVEIFGGLGVQYARTKAVVSDERRINGVSVSGQTVEYTNSGSKLSYDVSAALQVIGGLSAQIAYSNSRFGDVTSTPNVGRAPSKARMHSVTAQVKIGFVD